MGGAQQRPGHHAGGDGDGEPGAADEDGYGHGGEDRGDPRPQSPACSQYRRRNRRGDREQPAEWKETRHQADRDHQVDENRRLDDLQCAQATPGHRRDGHLRPYSHGHSPLPVAATPDIQLSHGAGTVSESPTPITSRRLGVLSVGRVSSAGGRTPAGWRPARWCTRRGCGPDRSGRHRWHACCGRGRP